MADNGPAEEENIPRDVLDETSLVKEIPHMLAPSRADVVRPQSPLLLSCCHLFLP